MKSYLAAVSLLALALGLTACGKGGIKEPPKVRVEVVNAAPGYDTLAFLRVKFVEGSLTYTAGSSYNFDVDQYDFHFDVPPPITTADVALANFTETLVRDRDYFFVAAQAAGQVVPIAFDAPAFDPASSDAQVVLVHADEQLGAADVYLEPDGTDLTTATPLGNVSFMDHTDPATKAPGDYVLTVTAPQDPGTILFQSSVTLTLTAGDSNLLVLAPSPETGLANVVLIQNNTSASTTLLDKNAKSALRVLNAVADQAGRDIYLDKDFTTPAYASLAYVAPSSYTTLSAGNHDVAVTPAGNVGTIELEQTQTLAPGVRYTYMVSGDSNGLSGTLVQEDHRSIIDGARIQFMDAATQFTTLYYFLAQPGTDISTLLPLATLTPSGYAAPTLFAPGDYELTIVDASTGATVGGPTPVTLNAGGIYGILAVNGADSSTAKAMIIDDSP